MTNCAINAPSPSLKSKLLRNTAGATATQPTVAVRDTTNGDPPSLTQHSVTLRFDPSPSPSLQGYRIRWGNQSGIYTEQAEIGFSTTATISTLLPGTYYFVATAYDVMGLESVPSNEVSWTTTVGITNFLYVIVQTSSKPNGPWTNLVTNAVDAVKAQKYFRAEILR